MADAGAKTGWKLFNGVVAVLAALAARKAIAAGWRMATGRKPPDAPESLMTPWVEAIGWAALSGTVVAVARLIASRSAAVTWMRSTGSPPPGMESGNKAA